MTEGMSYKFSETWFIEVVAERREKASCTVKEFTIFKIYKILKYILTIINYKLDVNDILMKLWMSDEL